MPSQLRTIAWGLALGLALPAAGAEPFERAPSLVSGSRRGASAARSSHPADLRARQQRQLDRSTAERNLEARAGIRAAGRDLELQRAAAAVRRDPSEQGVERLRQEARRAERADALASRLDLAELERQLGRPIGPVTRRVLLESQLDLHETRHRVETEEKIRSVEREMRDRRRHAPPAAAERPAFDRRRP